jgi:hypothetical protein
LLEFFGAGLFWGLFWMLCESYGVRRAQRGYAWFCGDPRFASCVGWAGGVDVA